MSEIKWFDNHIEVAPPKRTKKITGTRFASILGVNPWSTPFEIWCACTRTYEKPFEDTIYTLAGKAIEPKQIAYMHKAYGMNVVSPTDKFGTDYFNKTRGDFFPESDKFGGMWDALSIDGNDTTVLEFKTTKRSEDWKEDVPEYYALQAALYAYLYGTDKVIMIASFLEDIDYQKPDGFKPNVSNTITVSFNVSERYPNFEKYIKYATAWWEEYVLTGISPEFDENKDAEILKALRTNTLNPDTDINTLIAEAEQLTADIDAVEATISEKAERLKTVKDIIRGYAVKQFRDGDKKVSIHGSKFEWTVSKTPGRTSVDTDKLKADGIYDKYIKQGEPIFTLKPVEIKNK